MMKKPIDQPKVMDQIRGEENWKKMCAMLVRKYGNNHAMLTAEDIASFPTDKVFLTRGHPDAIQFYVISMEEAREIEAEIVSRGGVGLHE